MLDAYYEEESKKVTEASADIESQLYHEKPVSDAHDPVRRNAGGRRGRRRGRAVFAQTEFRPDMAEWHATPHLAPCLRVKGTALDIEAARAAGDEVKQLRQQVMDVVTEALVQAVIQRCENQARHDGGSAPASAKSPICQSSASTTSSARQKDDSEDSLD